MIPLKVVCFLVGLSSASAFTLDPVSQLYQNVLNTSFLSPSCAKAYEETLKLANEYNINALKMLDATAKIPSGLLSGNVNQYGDFDECLEVEECQYCLAEIDAEHLWQEPFHEHKLLVHSFLPFRDTFDDPAHRVAGFNMIRWGFCIPQQCTGEDLKRSLEGNFGVKVNIRPGMCQKVEKEQRTLSFGDYFARTFFIFLLCAVALSSGLDSFEINAERRLEANSNVFMKLLMCFSLRRNVESLFRVEENPVNEIEGLHGGRFLNALALLMSHKAISRFYNPYINRTSMVKTFSAPWSIIGKNAILFTDTFIFFSGLLNATALIQQLKRDKSIKFAQNLINRLFRIVPNLLGLILFCTYILPSMGSGPMWPLVVKHHAELCKKSLWKNLFFIHNYFGFEKMCLTHTHQVGIDMQLFIVTPLIVSLIWHKRQLGLKVLIILASVSTLLRFWATYVHELSAIVYFGVSVSKMFRTADYSYILPTHRATVYLIGVYLAFALTNLKRNQPHTTMRKVVGWILFLVPFLGTWWGPYHTVQSDYVYNKFEAALIAAISPVTWTVSVAFGIHMLNKYESITGFVKTCFRWKFFQITTKISYALYLVQFPVYFYNVGLVRSPQEFQPQYQLQIWETLTIIIAAIILVLIIEMPFQNIRRVIYNSNDKKEITKITTDIVARKTKFA